MRIIPVLALLSLAPQVVAQGPTTEGGLDRFAVTIFRDKEGVTKILATPYLTGTLSGDGAPNSPHIITWSLPKPENDSCNDELGHGRPPINCHTLLPSAREALARTIGILPARQYLERLHKEQQVDINKLPTTLQSLVNGAIQNDALAKDRIANAVLQVQKQIRDSLAAEKGVEIATLKKEVEDLRKKLGEMAQAIEGRLASSGQSSQGPPPAPKPAAAKPKGN